MVQVLPPRVQTELAINVDSSLDLEKWKQLWLFRGINYNEASDYGCPAANEVPGWLIYEDMSFLWKLAESLPKGGTYVEIGSYMGLTAVLFANALFARLNLSARIYCIDTWDRMPDIAGTATAHDRLFDHFSQNVNNSGLGHFIHPVVSDGAAAAGRFPDCSIDMIFLDAAHMSVEDINAWYPKLRKGGRFLGNGAVPGGAALRTVEEFAARHSLTLVYYNPPLAHHIWELSPQPAVVNAQTGIVEIVEETAKPAAAADAPEAEIPLPHQDEKIPENGLDALEIWSHEERQKPGYSKTPASFAYLRRCLDVCTTSLQWIHYTLGGAFYDAARFEEAKAEYTACLETGAFDRPLQIFIHGRLASIFELQGDLHEALKEKLLSYVLSFTADAAYEVLHLAERTPDFAAFLEEIRLREDDPFLQVLEIQKIVLPDLPVPHVPPYLPDEEVALWHVARIEERAAQEWDSHLCLNKRPLILPDRLVLSAAPIDIFSIYEGQVCYREETVVVLDCPGRIFKPLSNAHPPLDLFGNGFLQINGTVALIADHVSDPNYCHWLLDWVPRIRLLRSVAPVGIDQWLVYAMDKPYQQETLSMLGIEPEQVVELRKYPWIRAQRLIACTDTVKYTHPLRGGWEEHVNFLKESFLPPQREMGKKNRRLYVSRNDAGNRRVEGEEELVSMLSSDFGFTSVTLSSVTFREQARMFAEAEAVIGAHGAGLSNVVFCDPGTVVIEMFPPAGGSTTYFSLAIPLGLNYASITGFESGVEEKVKCFGSVEETARLACSVHIRGEEIEKIHDWLKISLERRGF